MEGTDDHRQRDDHRNPESLHWLRQLRDAAEKRARRYGLLNWLEDLMQEAATVLWAEGESAVGPPSPERMDEVVDRIAREEYNRRLGETRALKRVGTDDVHLEERIEIRSTLSDLGGFHHRPLGFRRTLLAASVQVARDSRVLNHTQHRLFVLRWGEQLPVEDILKEMHLPPARKRALTKRLSRISRKLQKRLIRGIAAHMNARDRAALAACEGRRGEALSQAPSKLWESIPGP